ncbi:hypothetical protein TEQG_05669 [Trichophyton equinum CBS 127.97]|uniref:Uncharacterized protein n=1 Tax=Trichophyton equinum (strain ATCC MYA-4606 / CBS 127.97) TaxID=559882 RepID=F2PXQ7_TRIEC|nr:hypothetical protein TEQG_05669 [Trichophyton equinum CBS 127.97]
MYYQQAPRHRVSQLTIIEVEFLHDLVLRQSTDAQHIIELERLLQKEGISNQRLRIANNTLSKQYHGLRMAQTESMDIREGLMREISELEEVIDSNKETIRLLHEQLTDYKSAERK